MSLRQITAVAVLALASFAAGKKGVEVPAQQAVTGTDTVAGCYSSLGDMIIDSYDEYNAQGYCAPRCRDKGKPVGATYLKACFCGTKMPNSKTLVSDSKCNEPCPGYDIQACGGLNAWTVYNTGVQVNVAEADLDTTSSTTSAAPTSTSTSQTSATETPTSAAETQSSSNSSKPNTVGIAVGVVVGVIVVGAIATGVIFYLRRKRNAELEEEHRRNAAVNAFISGGKPPRSSGGMSIADSRMDPVMNRRMSDGSIADNQDYSRRILRVTNA
ncbi:hypothetical protein O1611_g3673 [Lasiodiplodia mahajangana]|uniref:Uncharacterized protein n=1 Tax=Lasiodiplodia mahajangana TaxID=1108764 RepID=A0ACC2JRR4_9PEZI|nr:hypothetical protein O1611_g3673 [Lasiodiplodia mahajangana]